MGKRTRSFFLAILACCAVLLLTPVLAQTNRTQAGGLSQGAVDPFADLHKAAMEKHFDWVESNEALPDAIAGLPACSRDIPALIQKTRELCMQALAARGEYARKWREFSEGDMNRFTRLISERGPLRQEMEMSLGAAEKEIAELKLRKDQLRDSTIARGVSAGSAGKSLESLLQNAEQRAQTLHDALERWDEAQKYTQGSREHAQAVRDSVAQMQLLISAESSLFQSYYDSLERRAEFECWQVRDGQGPAGFPQYRPIKK